MKINVISLIEFKWFDVAYEYLIDEESSFGTSVLLSLGGDRDIDTYKSFSLTPYLEGIFQISTQEVFLLKDLEC